jgi:hypothetical protein
MSVNVGKDTFGGQDDERVMAVAAMSWLQLVSGSASWLSSS